MFSSLEFTAETDPMLRQLAIFLGLLIPCGVARAGESLPLAFEPVACEGHYRHHLQGVSTNDRDAIYWCFTTVLVKTDRTGKVLAQIEVGSHHGDLCHREGKVFVAVNFGKFNQPAGKADSWVYVYDAETLDLVSKHAIPEVVHGAGGMAERGGRFFVVGGLPNGIEENYVYEYDADFKFVKRHVLASGHTLLGIQTAAYADGHWWFGCYGKALLRVDASWQRTERFEFDASIGIVPLGKNAFLVARGGKPEQGYTGRLVRANADKEQGLKLP